MLLYVAVSIRWISIRFDFGIYNLKLFISVINEQICQGCQISIFSFFGLGTKISILEFLKAVS